MDWNWQWDETSGTYLCGTPKEGCGVFQEKDHWSGNVSAFGQLLGIGRWPDLEAAKHACGQIYQTLKKGYDE